jgi:hypothetical protein
VWHTHELQLLLLPAFLLCLAGNEASQTMFYMSAAIVGVVPEVGEPQRAQVIEKAAQVGVSVAE